MGDVLFILEALPLLVVCRNRQNIAALVHIGPQIQPVVDFMTGKIVELAAGGEPPVNPQRVLLSLIHI